MQSAVVGVEGARHALDERNASAQPLAEMRCYFHLIGPAETLLDEVGQNVSDIAEAEQAIFELIDEMSTEDPEIVDKLVEWRMHVVNHAGSTVLDLDLRSILRELARLRRVS